MTKAERRDPISLFQDLGFAQCVLIGLKHQHKGNTREAIEAALAGAERVEEFLRQLPYEVLNTYFRGEKVTLMIDAVTWLSSTNANDACSRLSEPETPLRDRL